MTLVAVATSIREKRDRRLAKLAGLEGIRAETPVGGNAGRRAPADETGGT